MRNSIQMAVLERKRKSFNKFDDEDGEMPPPQEAQPPRDDDWEKIIDDHSGEPYYFNRRTGDTTWEPPPGFDEHAHPRSEQQAEALTSLYIGNRG